MTASTPNNFLGLPAELADYARARVVCLPVPYEATVTFGGGTGKGPAAIIDASAQVELYDEELGCEPCDVGVATLAALDLAGVRPDDLHAKAAPAVESILRDKKFPLILGGEHSITPAAIKAVHAAHPDLTVLQFDAHADLRQEYEGERMSHACAMARVREISPVVQVGIRNLSKDEANWVERERLPVFFAHKMRGSGNWMRDALAAIKTDEVYITIDVDAFDSSIMPATGTPEPGGMSWYDVIDFIRLVTEKKRVVGFDIVELAPQPGLHACDFLAAKLAYKCIGFWSRAAGLI
ncbi:MAG: agmatinase [bacterium]